MTDWKKVAGAVIEDARVRMGLTRAQLADRAGTSQPTIVAYETGRRQPTLPTLYRILDAAGLDLRLRCVEHDPHDEQVAAWEASRSAAERKAWVAEQARFAEGEFAR